MKSFPGWLKIFFVAAVLALLSGGLLFYRAQEQIVRKNVESRLKTITELKASQIAEWRTDQLAEADELMASTFFIEGVTRWLADPEAEPSQEILAPFHSLKKHYLYSDVMLADANGDVRLSLSGWLGPPEPVLAKALSAAMRDREPVLTDLYTDEFNPTPHISAVAPLFGANFEMQKPVGVVILVSDARQFLYPRIQSWPTPSKTAETLIVRREGDEVLYLNDLRFQPDAALKVRVPLSQTNMLAVMAVLGREGVVQGKDYRGVEVLAVIRHIPDSPWFMEAKMDVEEAFASWRFSAGLILALMLALVILAGSVALVLWQRNQKAHYRALYQAEAARLASEKRYSITLKSIGDAVVATDAKGRVELLNPVAEMLTGWTNEEAHGKPLEKVFRIVNEDTRQPVENPVTSIIREGMVVGLANHTLLIARDGTERPIADAGAPIRDEKNEVLGIVLVFREQTEERAMQRALRESERKYRELVQNANSIILRWNAEGCVTFLNEFGQTFFGYTEPDILGRHIVGTIVPETESTGRPLRPLIEQILANPDAFTSNVNENIRRDGRRVWVSWYNRAIFDAQGRLVEVFSVGNDVTERKQAEEALRESETRFRRVFENSLMGIYRTSPDGRILLANPALVNMLRYRSFDELAQQNLEQGGFHPDYPRRLFKEAIERDDTVRGLESAWTRADGTTVFVRESAQAIRGADGRILHYDGVVEDITERKEAEEALREGEERYRKLVENSLSGIGISLGNEVIFANPTLLRIFGYENLEEFAKIPLLDHVAPASRDHIAARMEKVARREPVPAEFDYDILRKDGLTRTLQASSSSFMLGGKTYTQTTFQDITERKKAEEALQKAKAYAENLIMSANAMIVGLDANGHIQVFNEAAEKIAGYRKADLEGKNWFEVIVPKERYPHVWKEFSRLMEGGLPGEFENPILTKGGEERIISWRNSELREQNKIVGTISFGIDITERKRAEEALRESEAFRRRIFDTSRVPIVVMDTATSQYMDCNPAAAQIYRFSSREEVLGKTPLDVSAPVQYDGTPSPEKTRYYIEKAVAEGSVVFEWRHQRPDGEIWDAEVHLMSFQSGKRHLLQFTLQDITERKQAEVLLHARAELAEAAQRGSLDELLQLALDKAELLTGSSIGFFHFLDADQENLQLQTWSTNTLKKMCTAEGKGRHYPVSEAGVWVDCIRTRAPVIHNDYAALPHKKGLPPGHAAVVRELVVPILRDGLVTGIMGVGNKATNYTQDDVRMAEALASIVVDHALRKRAEEAVEESRQMLRSVLDTIPVRVFWKDLESRYLGCNRPFARDSGLKSPQALLGKDDYAMGWRAQADMYRADDKAVMSSGIPKIQYEEPQTAPDGSQLWLRTSKIPLRDAKGKIIGVLGTYEDITERKLAEEAMRESEERYRVLFEGAAEGITMADVATREIRYANPAVCEMFGYAKDELSRLRVDDLHPKDSVQHAIAGFNSQMRGEKILTPNIPCLRKDGSVFYADINARPVVVAGRLMAVGFFNDITERKQAEEAVRESQALYHSLAEQLPIGVFRKDREGRYVLVNPEFCRLKGMKAEDFLGKTPQEVAAVEVAKQGEMGLATKYTADGKAHHEQILRTGKPIELVEEYVHADGRKQFLRVMKLPVIGPDGKIIGSQGIQIDITERKQAEETIAHERQLLRTLIDLLPEMFYIKDLDSRFLVANEALAKQWGKANSSHLLGLSDADLFPAEVAAKYRDEDLKVFAGEPLVGREGTCVFADGREHMVLTTKVPYRDSQGRICGLVGIGYDITERRRAEEALQEAGERFQLVTRATNDAVWDWNMTSPAWWNDAFYEVYGFDRNTPPSLEAWASHIHPDDRERVMTRFRAVVEHGEATWSDEFRFRRADGTYGHVFDRAYSLRDASGKTVRMIGSMMDITERKRAEEKIARTAREWQTTFDATNDAIWILDKDHRVLRSNHTAERYFKRPCEEMLGKPCWEIVHGTTEPIPDCPFVKAQKSGHRESMELQMDERWFEIIVDPILDAKGQYDGAVHIVSDITQRRRAEERIREQAALLDAANDAIYVRAPDHTVTYWNDAAERLYGWKRAEVLGRKIHELTPYDVGVFETAHAALLEQGSWSGELTIATKAGRKIVVFCRWTVLRDEQGQPKEILAINTDITERKQLEANFLRAQRLEGIGALAGGIAHDLNNILQPILMTAQLLRETATDSESREMLGTVRTYAQRGADIIKQLLTFARGSPGVRVPLPIRHLLRDMEKIVHETFPRNIRPRINAPNDLWLILGDATQIQQALMNLSVNARDAMPDGGTLTLTAENLTLDETFTAMMPDAKPGLFVCVSVSDTGTGIQPEHLDRIFEPFFTTKEIGKGTGLGLATVLGIVRGHGGFVRVNSQVGHGTTFELYFPAAPEAKAAAMPEHEKLPPRANGELILVVDDEAGVRRVIQRTLENHGYKVMTAAEGAEAVTLLGRHRAEGRAVITDMMMPGMDGPSLVRALRELEPRLPIVGMTGLGSRTGVKGMESLDLPALLVKPFAGAKLLTVLHQALTAAAGKKGKAEK